MSCCEPTQGISSAIGPVLSEMLSVATIADLAPLTYGDGTSVYVRSVRDFWVCRAGSSATVDSITVVARSTGTGRWERLNVPHPSWALQTAWFIDPAAGNDENAGDTSGTALKTTTEWTRRGVGQGQTRVTTTTTLIGSLPATETLHVDVTVSPGTVFAFHGTKTVGFSGTLSAKTDLSTASTNGDLPTATSTWTLPGEVFRLVKDITNSRYAWVLVDLGGGAAELSPWIGLNETAGSTFTDVTQGNTTVGASVETYTLSQITRAAVTVKGTGNRNGAAVSTALFQNLEFLNTEVSCLTAMNAIVCWQNCIFGTGTRLGAGLHAVNNCLNRGGNLSIGYSGFVQYSGGACTASWANSAQAGFQTFEFCLNLVFSGAICTLNRGSICRVRNVFFRGLGASTAFTLLEGAILKLSSSTVCGAGNTGLAVSLSAGSRVDCVGTTASQWKISGAAAPISFAGSTSCPALDPATFAFNATARSLTYANIDATYAAGGFGGRAQDPRNGCGFGLSP
jgi:hypothetical protein